MCILVKNRYWINLTNKFCQCGQLLFYILKLKPQCHKDVQISKPKCPSRTGTGSLRCRMRTLTCLSRTSSARSCRQTMPHWTIPGRPSLNSRDRAMSLTLETIQVTSCVGKTMWKTCSCFQMRSLSRSRDRRSQRITPRTSSSSPEAFSNRNRQCFPLGTLLQTVSETLSNLSITVRRWRNKSSKGNWMHSKRPMPRSQTRRIFRMRMCSLKTSIIGSMRVRGRTWTGSCASRSTTFT